jgi:hypothetical protein
MLNEKQGGVLEAIVHEPGPGDQHPVLIHDVGDNVTPVEDSRAVAQAWRSARYIETKGLGHRGALQSGEIHEQVVEFFSS